MDVLIRHAFFVAALSVLSLVSGNTLHASGHGPVFGAATPTLGKGGWSFDQALMGQAMDGSGTTALRSMDYPTLAATSTATRIRLPSMRAGRT